MTELVTFGETMAALRGAGPLRLGATMELSIAGSESNLAIAVARLGHSVEWIGRVGDDELGQLVLRTLRAEGVHLAAAIVDDQAPTGLLLFERRIADLVRVAYFRAGSAGSRIRAADVLDRLTPEVSVLHVTGVTAALGPDASDAVHASARTAHERGITVSLDVNFRSRLWTAQAARTALRPLLPYVDLVFASEDELPLVGPDSAADPGTAARQLIDEGTDTVVVKRGAAGATAYSSGGKISTPARAVPVVDVVGAGDAFVGGYLSARMDGSDTAACLERGVVVGAFAVARVGDWEGLPTRDDLALLDAPPGTTIR